MLHFIPIIALYTKSKSTNKSNSFVIQNGVSWPITCNNDFIFKVKVYFILQVTELALMTRDWYHMFSNMDSLSPPSPQYKLYCYTFHVNISFIMFINWMWLMQNVTIYCNNRTARLTYSPLHISLWNCTKKFIHIQ